METGSNIPPITPHVGSINFRVPACTYCVQTSESRRRGDLWKGEGIHQRQSDEIWCERNGIWVRQVNGCESWFLDSLCYSPWDGP